jgi:hypothetical protein
MKMYQSLDELILKAPTGTLLTPICAKEVLVLRTLGTRWQNVTRTVVRAHNEVIAQGGGFGPVDFKLYITRKYMDGNVVKTIGQEIAIPQEFFTWPL